MIGLAEEEYKKGMEEMLKTTEIFTFVLYILNGIPWKWLLEALVINN